MCKDMDTWCHASVKCASRSVGQTVRPKLTPITVGGLFDHAGVDVLQLPKTKRGNRYAVVFNGLLDKVD